MSFKNNLIHSIKINAIENTFDILASIYTPEPCHAEIMQDALTMLLPYNYVSEATATDATATGSESKADAIVHSVIDIIKHSLTALPILPNYALINELLGEALELLQA